MKSVSFNEYTLFVKNSRFICCVYSIESLNEVSYYLDSVKKKYPDATHYCYAYILNGVSRVSDDGEPSGTAGMPILGVLKKNDLEHVLCIVVRYFGKIKLGAGGLIRAYTKSVVSCLDGHIVSFNKGYLIEITFPYSYVKKIDHLLKDEKIVKKEFGDLVLMRAIVRESLINYLDNFDSNVNFVILKEVFYNTNND